jgi:CheY-like chemotaxis protein
LTVETANVNLDDQGHYGDAGPHTGSHVMLSVSDTGVGMDARTRERVFEPFFTTKELGSGTGLGLSTVYGIVKQSQGAVDVESEPGRGTTFRIFLPRVAEPLGNDLPTATQTSMPIGRETVLLVEDEDALRALMADTLRGYGFQVISSPTSAEALRLVEGEGQRPDVLVTDVVLPGGMQGNELADRLVSLLPGLPVLFVSGYSRDAIVHEGRLDPSVNLLQKPFSPKVLAETLGEVLNRRRPPKRRA